MLSYVNVVSICHLILSKEQTYTSDQPQDIDVLCVQPNEIAQNAVEPIFLEIWILQQFEQFHLAVHIKCQCPVDQHGLRWMQNMLEQNYIVHLSSSQS